MLDVFLDVEPIAVCVCVCVCVCVSGSNTYITYEVVSAKEKKSSGLEDKE